MVATTSTAQAKTCKSKTASKPIPHNPRLPINRPPPRIIRSLPRLAPPPELFDANYMFCLDRLVMDVGPLALRSLSQTTISALPPRGYMPATLPVRLAGPIPPTHALAVFTPASTNLTIFLTHKIIFATHCTKLPPLPSPEHLPEGHLPVQSLCLPHPESFGPLMQFLYSHRQDRLFNELCPGVQMFSRQPHLSWHSEGFKFDSREDVKRVVQMMFASHSRQSVQQSMHFIYGLWSNLTVLGIHEAGAWEVLQVAWHLHLLTQSCLLNSVSRH